MQICNNPLKKARDHKRKRFFYSTDGVIFNWAPSQNSPLFYRIIFFWLFFLSAYLKSLSKNDQNITHAQLTKFSEIPFLCPLQHRSIVHNKRHCFNKKQR